MSDKNKIASNDEERRIAGQAVKLTNLSKLYWPDENITKGDLIDYYQSIAGYILPYLKDRPQSLLRHPNGINVPGFYQKDAGDKAPDWVETKRIHSESTNEEVNYILCQNQATLAYLNNLGCIQLNPWNSRINALETPDWAVIDLDPGENTYDEVVEVALVVKEIADKIGADCYVKTSGATGMHLYFPLQAKYSFAEVKAFAHLLAQKVHQRLPKLTSLERMPKERRYQIYLDFLQNAISQTIAAPYCVRPKPGATVSAPLAWSEVKKGLHPSQFTIKNMPARLQEKGDLFKGVLGKNIDLPKCLQALKALQD
ncbi:MAG: non-homologous end-joining DNA ligase [Adhaeribacter sp.]